MNRILRYLSLATVVAFGVFAVGCGGSDDKDAGSNGTTAVSESDEAAINDLAAKIQRATKTANAKVFCELFDPAKLDEWVGAARCVKIFGPALKQAPKNTKYEVKSIEIDGDSATVDLGFGATTLERVDGNWYIETPEQSPSVSTPE